MCDHIFQLRDHYVFQNLEFVHL